MARMDRRNFNKLLLSGGAAWLLGCKKKDKTPTTKTPSKTPPPQTTPPTTPTSKPEEIEKEIKDLSQVKGIPGLVEKSRKQIQNLLKDIFKNRPNLDAMPKTRILVFAKPVFMLPGEQHSPNKYKDKDLEPVGYIINILDKETPSKRLYSSYGSLPPKATIPPGIAAKQNTKVLGGAIPLKGIPKLENIKNKQIQSNIALTGDFAHLPERLGDAFEVTISEVTRADLDKPTPSNSILMGFTHKDKYRGFLLQFKELKREIASLSTPEFKIEMDSSIKLSNAEKLQMQKDAKKLFQFTSNENKLQKAIEKQGIKFAYDNKSPEGSRYKGLFVPILIKKTGIEEPGEIVKTTYQNYYLEAGDKQVGILQKAMKSSSEDEDVIDSFSSIEYLSNEITAEDLGKNCVLGGKLIKK